MRLKTTLILLVFVGAMLLVWAIVQQKAPLHGDLLLGRPLLPDLRPERVVEIAMNDSESGTPGDSVRLFREESGWMVEYPGPEGAIRSKARPAAVSALLSTLQDVKPRRLISASPAGADLQRMGLGSGQGARIEARSSDGAVEALHLGAFVGEGDLLCRTSRSPAVLAIPSELKRSLLPGIIDLEDPFLFPLTPLDVQRIRVEVRDREPFEIEWSFSRWFLLKPLEGAPADPLKSDQLRRDILLLAAGERHPSATFDGWESPPLGRIVLRDRLDRPHTLEWNPAGPGRVYLKSSSRQEVLSASEDALQFAHMDWRVLRDPAVFDLTANQVLRVRVRHRIPGPADFTLARASEKEFLFREVEGVAVNLHHGDPVEVAGWIESLRSLKAASFDDSEPEFEPVLDLKLLAALGGGSSGTEMEVVAGAEVDGRIPLRVAGQAGTLWLAAGDLDFLDRPYWSLMERIAWLTDGYFRFGRIRITGEEGRVSEFRGELRGSPGDLVLFALEEAGEREIPEATTRAFQHIAVGGFRMKEFLGPGTNPAFGFETPMLVLEWLEPEGASPASIPDVAEGRWKKLLIGARRVDGLYHGVVLPEPGLVFLTDGAPLRPILSLHALGGGK